MIDLYTANTSNGQRAAIILEECGLPAHRLRGVSPRLASLVERHIHAGDVLVEHGLIERIATFNDDVVHPVGKTRIANEGQDEVVEILGVVPKSEADEWLKRVGEPDEDSSSERS